MTYFLYSSFFSCHSFSLLKAIAISKQKPNSIIAFKRDTESSLLIVALFPPSPLVSMVWECCSIFPPLLWYPWYGNVALFTLLSYASIHGMGMLLYLTSSPVLVSMVWECCSICPPLLWYPWYGNVALFTLLSCASIHGMGMTVSNLEQH